MSFFTSSPTRARFADLVDDGVDAEDGLLADLEVRSLALFRVAATISFSISFRFFRDLEFRNAAGRARRAGRRGSTG